MDEGEFNARAEAMLARIEEALEASAADIDVVTKPGGVLELEFDNGSKIVINRHGAAREIWLAAKSGGYHFRPDASDPFLWRGRDGSELFAILGSCIREQAGIEIDLPKTA